MSEIPFSTIPAFEMLPKFTHLSSWCIAFIFCKPNSLLLGVYAITIKLLSVCSGKDPPSPSCWHLVWSSGVFARENAFDYVTCNMAAILWKLKSLQPRMVHCSGSGYHVMLHFISSWSCNASTPGQNKSNSSYITLIYDFDRKMWRWSLLLRMQLTRNIEVYLLRQWLDCDNSSP